MGFGAAINKLNRDLQIRTRSRHFRGNGSPTNSSSFRSGTNQPYIGTKPSRKTIREQILTILIAGILSYLLYYVFSPMIVQLDQKVEAHEANIRLEFAEALKKEQYHFLLKSGEYHFQNGAIDLARGEFQRGLALFPTGKEALIGISKCLSHDCETKGVHCEEADVYMKALETSR